MMTADTECTVKWLNLMITIVKIAVSMQFG